MHPIHWFPPKLVVLPLRLYPSTDTWVVLALVVGTAPWVAVAVELLWPRLLP